VLRLRRATPPNSEVIGVHLLHFKPVFDHLLKKVVKRPPSSEKNALIRFGHFLARVKIRGRSTP